MRWINQYPPASAAEGPPQDLAAMSYESEPYTSLPAPPVEHAGSARSGFTMVEVIVTLVLLALAAAIVAPSLLTSHTEKSSELGALMGSARTAAIRRGETIRLRIDRSGAWRAVTGTPPQTNVLMSGQLTDPPAGVTDLLFSPIGTCAPTVESDPAEILVTLDPLTCEVSPS